MSGPGADRPTVGERAPEPYVDEILIYDDGTVSFKHLTEALLEVASELNPDDQRIRARMCLKDA